MFGAVQQTTRFFNSIFIYHFMTSNQMLFEHCNYLKYSVILVREKKKKKKNPIPLFKSFAIRIIQLYNKGTLEGI